MEKKKSIFISPESCIHGEVCLCMCDYIRPFLSELGKSAYPACVDVMHDGGCKHYKSKEELK